MKCDFGRRGVIQMNPDEVDKKVMVDRSEVDEAMKKVKKLNRLLKKANSLRNELAKNEVVIKLTVTDIEV